MRGKTTNVIELNGNLYDARTGKPVNKKSKPINRKQANTAAPVKKSSRPVDGFAVNKAKPVAKPKIVVANEPKPQARKVDTRKNHSKAPTMKHGVQRSKTLNRKAVKPPTLQVPSEIMPHTVKLKEDVNKRLDRAMQVSKSTLVNRFPKTTATVAEQVSKLPSRSSEPKKEEPKATLVHEKITKQSSPAPPTVKEAPKTTSNKQVAQKSKRRLKKKHFSRAGAVVIGVCILAAIGYFIYLNVPAVSTKVAASQAGFTATLPSYTPTGYHVDGPVQSNGGVVTLKYKSGADSKTFVLTQQQSAWDAEALKENYIATQTDTEPTTQQYNGLTIYLYDGKAAWINAGTLYALNTNGTQLGVDQILKLATST